MAAGCRGAKLTSDYVSGSLSAGRYVGDSCVYGPGDLPWIIRAPSLFASKFDSPADPTAVTCLERRHRRRALRQAEVPADPHWRFRQQRHLNAGRSR